MIDYLRNFNTEELGTLAGMKPKKYLFHSLSSKLPVLETTGFERNSDNTLPRLSNKSSWKLISGLLLVFTVRPQESKSKTTETIKSKKLKNITGCRKLLEILFVEVHVCTAFRTRVIRQNVPHKFTEHSMETPCWCPCRVAPTWRPEINENIRNSLLL